MIRAIFAFVLSCASVNAECHAYWFSKQQEKLVHLTQKKPHTDRIRLNGKWAKYTERTTAGTKADLTLPMGLFRDTKLVGVACH